MRTAYVRSLFARTPKIYAPCMSVPLRTFSLGQSDHCIPPGESGRMSVRHVSVPMNSPKSNLECSWATKVKISGKKLVLGKSSWRLSIVGAVNITRPVMSCCSFLEQAYTCTCLYKSFMLITIAIFFMRKNLVITFKVTALLYFWQHATSTNYLIRIFNCLIICCNNNNNNAYWRLFPQ